jgi:hypothetical protein
MAEKNRNQQDNSDQQQTGNTNQQSNNFENPQRGDQWDNYQTRELSGNTGRDGGDDALNSEGTPSSDQQRG